MYTTYNGYYNAHLIAFGQDPRVHTHTHTQAHSLPQAYALKPQTMDWNVHCVKEVCPGSSLPHLPTVWKAMKHDLQSMSLSPFNELRTQ